MTRQYKILMLIMRDVTDEELSHRRKEEISPPDGGDRPTRVVDKQMRIVQQIASLLGETAAETKIALSQAEGVDPE